MSLFEKRMLHFKDGVWYVNSSSVEVLQNCYRKGEYLFDHGLKSESSKAQTFGTIVHETLAGWYMMPAEMRTSMVMIEIFNKFYTESGYEPEDGSPKTKENGLKTMLKYVDVFKDDQFEIVMHAGRPMIEWSFEYILQGNIRYFGTIDLVVRDKVTGKIYVFDHKTASALGIQFNNSWNPNHQMTGYIWALNQAGLECSDALIQGIQVMKTKWEVCRVPTHRTEENFQDWKSTVVDLVERYASYQEHGFFPHAGNHACSAFSGCQFLDLCKSSREVRKDLIERRKYEIATAKEMADDPDKFKQAREALVASAKETYEAERTRLE